MISKTFSRVLLVAALLALSAIGAAAQECAISSPGGSGGGGGGVGGSGTSGRVARFTAGTTLGDSLLADDAANVTLTSGRFLIGTGPSLKNATGTLQIRNTGDTAFANGSLASLVFNGATSGTLTLTPAATTTSYTLTLPAADGAGALTSDGAGNLSWAAAGGTPGGSNTQVQFNDSSAFGGDSGLTFDKTADVLGVGTAIALGAAPSTTSTVRLSNLGGIYFRNAANSANLRLIENDSGNAIHIGSSSSAVTVHGDGVTLMSLTGSVLSFGANNSAVAYTDGSVLYAGSDASKGLGAMSARWANVYAVASHVASANGALGSLRTISEAITLSTSGTTTDSVANLLPANAIILSVSARVTTTITGATDWELGDATTAARFLSPVATLTAGTTAVGLNHLKGGVSTDAAGPVQTSAAQLRITTTGTPSAGVIRVTVVYLDTTPPTS